MAPSSAYAVVRVHDDTYRLDRTEPPATGAAAFVIRVRDRFGNPLGWKLKPLVVMQGAKSHIWLSAADAIAATKLMTPKEANTAVARATASATASASAIGTTL